MVPLASLSVDKPPISLFSLIPLPVTPSGVWLPVDILEPSYCDASPLGVLVISLFTFPIFAGLERRRKLAAVFVLELTPEGGLDVDPLCFLTAVFFVELSPLDLVPNAKRSPLLTEDVEIIF